jgi:hypothetical protein
MTTEFLDMRRRAEETVQNIEQISNNLDSERRILRQIVEEYGVKRIELLKEELHMRGLTWCTLCAQKIENICSSKQDVILERDVDFILLEGRETYSCGYENSCYGFRNFSGLHRVCLSCRESAHDKHGSRGDYDTSEKDQTSFFAFRVEKRDDGYYARKFGVWMKLNDKNCKLPEPSSQLVDRLAEEWNLPPRIEFYRDDKLVIRERATVKTV